MIPQGQYFHFSHRQLKLNQYYYKTQEKGLKCVGGKERKTDGQTASYIYRQSREWIENTLRNKKQKTDFLCYNTKQ